MKENIVHWTLMPGMFNSEQHRYGDSKIIFFRMGPSTVLDKYFSKKMYVPRLCMCVLDIILSQFPHLLCHDFIIQFNYDELITRGISIVTSYTPEE